MAHHTGAILQRDGKTFGVVTRIPGGIVTPDTLEKIAAVARNYRVPMVKLTSGQRVMLIGLKEQDLLSIYQDLGQFAEYPAASHHRAISANTPHPRYSRVYAA